MYLDGTKRIVNLFCVRLCYSCRPIVLAYRKQNEESFLDAFVNIFNILGGTTVRVIFDNDKVAVKDGFGVHARMQDDYSALSAHYGFDAVFCNPAESHEKGLVGKFVGWVHHNIYLIKSLLLILVYHVRYLIVLFNVTYSSVFFFN